MGYVLAPAARIPKAISGSIDGSVAAMLPRFQVGYVRGIDDHGDLNAHAGITLLSSLNLGAGEYQLSITPVNSHNETGPISFTVDDTLKALPSPDATNFGWYHERTHAYCTSDERSIIEIDRPATAPDYYEAVMRDEEGEESHDLLPASDTTTTAVIKEDVDTDCVTVTGVMSDGTRGESVEDCRPQLLGPGCFSDCQTTAGSAPTGYHWLLFAALFGLFALNRRSIRSGKLAE